VIVALAVLATSACSGDGDDGAKSDRTLPEVESTDASLDFDDPGESAEGFEPPSGPPEEPLDRSACEVFLQEDLTGMTKFAGTTFVVVDSVDEPPDPDDVVRAHSSRCGYNTESHFQDGGGSGGSGIWAYLTLTNDLRAFDPDPTWPEYEAVDGVGDDAYFTDGGFTLVVLAGDYVVEIESSVGLDLDQFPDVVEGRQQLILALVELVLPRL
jgi:hypothetical protein